MKTSVVAIAKHVRLPRLIHILHENIDSKLANILSSLVSHDYHIGAVLCDEIGNSDYFAALGVFFTAVR